jgi:hypothetical protein
MRNKPTFNFIGTTFNMAMLYSMFEKKNQLKSKNIKAKASN